MSNKSLIYIAGPTGVGKTKISIELAKKFNTEIISCDSRQFYKELKIGTSPPSDEQLREVNHHFIHNKSILDDYSVGDYEKESINIATKLFKKRDYLILVGGSGLYFKALMYGISQIPKIPKIIKEQVPELNSAPFITLYEEDKLGGMIRNLEYWLRDNFSQFKLYSE